jgi:hypothetical protein
VSDEQIALALPPVNGGLESILGMRRSLDDARPSQRGFFCRRRRNSV